MVQIFSPIGLGFNADQTPNLSFDGQHFATWGDVVAKVTGLDAPENVVNVARAMTHFSYKARYRVIEDPEDYEARYRARVATEDPDQPFEQNQIRSSSFGIPDFSEISAPQIINGKLRYFVADVALHVPYRVEGDPISPDLATQSYELLALSSM